MGDQSDGIVPGFVFRALGHWYKIALPAGVLLAAISASLTLYFFEPVYRASSWIRIARRTPYIAYQSADNMDKSEQFVQTQIELIRSSLVIGPAVSQPEIARLPEVAQSHNPAKDLRGTVKVKQIGKSELYEVTCDAHDPGTAETVVNAIVDEYFSLRSQDDISQTQRVLELLDEERQRRAREVQRLREDLRKLGKAILAPDPLSETPTSSASLSNKPLLQLQERLANVEVESKILEARVQAADEALSNENFSVPEFLIEAELENDPQIRKVMGALAQKRMKLGEIEATAIQGKDDPAYQRLLKNIRRAEEELEEVRNELRPQALDKLQSLAVIRQRDVLAEMRSNLDRNRLLEDMLRKRYDAMLKETAASGDQTFRMEALRAELAREERAFDIIAERATALRTETRAPGRIKLMKRAERPEAPLEVAPWSRLAGLSLASFCFPFFLAIAREWKVGRITNAEQLELLGTVPMVAEIAKLPGRIPVRKDGAFLGRVGKALNAVEESVDCLRTCLVLPDEHREVQALAVVSAVNGEGKTTVASQLAVSIARSSGEPTLLIDADMRGSDLHHIFQVPREPGLAGVLDGQCSLDEAIITSWSDHVHLLPAGVLHKNPHYLVGKGHFASLLEDARSRYRYVLIDTPPILWASESLVMAKHADAVVICAMRDRSRETQIRLAHARLLQAGIQPAGAVLNAVDTSQYASSYGSYASHRSA